MRAVLVLAALFASIYMASADVGKVISITNMDDPPQNYMLLFNADDAANPIQKIDYEYYEDTTAGALDTVRGRYLLMTEQGQVLYYNLSSLEQTNTLQLPVQQIPDSMMYDASKDLIWLVNVGESTVTFCSVTAGGIMNCVATVQGSYSYTADASAFDPASGMLYVQLESMDRATATAANNAQPLFVLDTNAGTVSGPVPMIDLCQEMDVATLGGVNKLICVDFITNIVVSVDPTTGKWTDLFNLMHAPQPYTVTVDNSNPSSPVLYAELTGIFENKWASFDLNTGVLLSNSTVNANLQLQLAFFVPPSIAL